MRQKIQFSKRSHFNTNGYVRALVLKLKPFYCQISQYGTDNYQHIILKRKNSVKIA